MQSRKELYDVIHYYDFEALDQTIAKTVLPDDDLSNEREADQQYK